ncbi:prepilin-type N-terminal cleavage/methylation domain-containing protein [Ruminococcaceae bacterium R-25]|nr:prepilin-type N-terminal cleavage/methylation domain-containing protein [Ruminococcaceae bacterium R-25]SUQ21940.1 prepilin-type N-terminal cleavage/methylation domain-containing protein [Oscillospiraceae bacterium]
MKRVIKKINKKGFTLVETLLATFILVVISTMLVNGFIATMGYSYQTSVYSKSGANNYSACMDDLALWNTYPNRGATSRQQKLSTVPATSLKTLSFETPSGVAAIKDLYVSVQSENTLTNTVPNTLSFGGAAYAPKDGTTEHGGAGSDQLADNRKTIKYYPEYWRGPNSNANSFYKVFVVADYANKDSNGNPTYHWVALDSYEVSDTLDCAKYLPSGSEAANHYIGNLNSKTHISYGQAAAQNNNENAG